MSGVSSSRYSRRLRDRFSVYWSAQLRWFAQLDASDKLGVVLLLMTGFGFIVMLAKAASLQFGGFPVVGAASVRHSCPAFLHEGCERFLLEEGLSPFSKHARVVFFPYPEARLKDCLQVLDDARQQPHKIYIPRVPLGLKINCTGQFEDHDYGGSTRRSCVGMDAEDAFLKEQDYLNQGALSREMLNMLVREKKRPMVSHLVNDSEEKAADFILKYSGERFEELGLSAFRCDEDESLELSEAVFKKKRACFLKGALVDFLWAVHREGFEKSIEKNFEKFRAYSSDLTPWAKAMVVRYLALIQQLQEFSARLDVREYVVVLLDRCVVNPNSCKPELAELFSPVRESLSRLSNSSVLVLDPMFE